MSLTSSNSAIFTAVMHEIHVLGQSTSVLEIAAMLSGLLGVWLTIRRSVWCFPVGILNVVLYAILFFSPGIQLYADALLQCFYTLLLVYGWIQWTHSKKDSHDITPYFMEGKIILKVVILVACATVALGSFLHKYTSASFPWIDSTLTCASLAAQWMIAKKYVENWITWILVDIAYIPLYLVKHLPFTALLYVIFLVMAVQGFREWKISASNE